MKRQLSDLGIVEYSKLIPTLGILAGLALTFGFPIVVLKVFTGQGIADGVISGMMIIGVSGGVLITLFSAVFGISMPGRVSSPPAEVQDDSGADAPVAACGP